MLEEKINKEKKQLRLFYKLKKAGILCLSLGGAALLITIIEIIILVYHGNFDLAALAEIQLVLAILAMEIGLPMTIVFSIFVNKKEKNIYNLRRNINN